MNPPGSQQNPTKLLDLHTPLTDILGCKLPIIGAGMGGVARAELAAAVSEAGGLGTLGMVRERPEFIEQQVKQLRSLTDRPYSVNIIPAATDAELLAEQIACLIDLRVPVVTLFWDIDEGCIQALRKQGSTVMYQIGSPQEALDAEAAGVDILIAQGFEAGGHVRGRIALQNLLPAVCGVTRLPVVAAGGIANGQQLLAAMALGAQGVCIGTRFLASEESSAHEFHKAKIVLADASDTVHTECFHINWPESAPVRVLRSSVTEQASDPAMAKTQRSREIGTQDGKPIYLYSTDSPLAGATGSLELMPLYCGHSCAQIDSVLPVAELMRQFVAEAESAMKVISAERGSKEEIEKPEMTSSPCSIGEVEGLYGGYADLEEVKAMLLTLLEAERAGAQVCALSLKDADSREWREFLRAVHKDEAASCKLLIDCLQSLGIEPHEEVGDFVEKCMRIPDFIERMRLLNKGQAWVVRKLSELLPRLQSEFVRAKLLQMKNEHSENIAKLEASLEAEAQTGSG